MKTIRRDGQVLTVPDDYQEPPHLLIRVKNFSLHAIAHFCNGMPTCLQSQIDERLAICKACPLYNQEAEICTHEKCGCGVGRQQKFLNKLAWADQECPDGRWKRLDHSE